MFRNLGIILLLGSNVVFAQEASYLCNENENVIFGCTIKNKVVSICSSAGFTQSTGYVQYRFGTQDNIELEYPKEKTPPKGKFFFSHTPYSGGGASIIRFNNFGHEYLIFDSMVRTNFEPDEPNYPDFKAGIVTRYKGKITSSRLCVEDASIRAAAYENLEQENFDTDVIPE